MSDVPRRPLFVKLARSRRRRHLDVLCPRPETRADCAGVARPCHFVGCVHSLFLDLLSPTEQAPFGTIKFNFPHPEDMPPDASCVLDVVEARGEMTLEEFARVMRISDERVRQIDHEARAKIAPELKVLAKELVERDVAMKNKTKKNGASALPKGAVEKKRYTEKLACAIEADKVA